MRQKTSLGYNAWIFLPTSEMVAYLRNQTDSKKTFPCFIGKSRIAPMKQLSIPRLGVQATLCALRLRQGIISNHGITVKR